MSYGAGSTIFKSAKRRSRREEEPGVRTTADDTPEAALQLTEERRQVRQILAEMSAREVELLLARADGATDQEIAMEQDKEFVLSKLRTLAEPISVDDFAVERAWAKVSEPRRRSLQWRWRLAAAATIAGLGLLSPTGRALAEDVWTRLLLRRTVAVELELEGANPSLLLRNVFPVTAPDRAARRQADSPLAASALAGFLVRTLYAPLLPYEPRFVIDQTTVQERVFDLAEAKADLRKIGRPEPEWPVGIDRARIVLDPQGKSATNYYGNCPKLVGPWTSCAFLVQSPSMVLRLPGHLAPVAYARLSLELAGVPKGQATTLARLLGASPTLFIPLETKEEVRKVRVRGTEAMLITYPTDPSGGDRIRP